MSFCYGLLSCIDAQLTWQRDKNKKIEDDTTVEWVIDGSLLGKPTVNTTAADNGNSIEMVRRTTGATANSTPVQIQTERTKKGLHYLIKP